MDDLLQDLRYSIRKLGKSPGFALLVIFILAVGIGANVAMFGVIDATLLQPPPYPDPDRLVVGQTTFDGEVNPLGSAQDYRDYKQTSTAFTSLAAIRGFTLSRTVTGVGEPERVIGVTVSAGLFRTLGVDPLLGRHFTPDEGESGGPPVAIISHGYWQRRFGGSPDVIDRTITIDGHPHTVIGVMPGGFRFLFDVEVWRPMRIGGPFAGARRFHNWLMVGRLKEGATLEAAQGEVDLISTRLQQQYPESNEGKTLRLTPLHDALVEDYRPSLILLMGALGLVLLIACGNVAGLLLARGNARRAELSIRAALGAGRARLGRQLLTESLLLALAGGVLGAALALWTGGLMVRVLPLGGLAGAGIDISPQVLAFALGLSVTTGVAFGILPAVRGARTDLVDDLRSGGRTTDAEGARFRGGLVVAQVAVSVVLLVGAGLLLRSFARLTGVNPGFRTEELLTAEIRLPTAEYDESEKRIRFFTELLERVEALPGVSGVALTNQLPIRDPGNNTAVFDVARPPQDQRDLDLAFQRTVLPGYFRVMGIPLLRGRGIEETDRPGAPRVIVINRTMAEAMFPGGNAIGQRVSVDVGDARVFEVVGVVGDVRMSGLSAQPRMALYMSYYQRPGSTMRLAVRTPATAGLVGPLRETVWSLDPNIPLADVATMEEVLRRSVAGYRVQTLALTIFAGVALLLAAVGLYGVLAYYVGQRLHEIGIRMALGADSGRVLGMVLWRGLALACMGIGVGLAIAIAGTRLLEGQLYGIEASDPTTLVAVSLFFVMVAALASLLPGWRAVRVNPAEALQAE